MTKIKKIAILTTHSFGYIDFLVEELERMESVDLKFINIDAIPFKYKNFFSRIRNFMLKILAMPSLKDRNKTNFIKEAIQKQGIYDQILIIRPDKLERKVLDFLRAHSLEMTSYLFDGIENFPKQKKTLSYFDTVYSYDKMDVKNYQFEFITNYIYDTQIEIKPITASVFNITSYDDRFPLLEKIAAYFSANKISFRFIIKKDKIFEHDTIEVVKNYLSLSEVKQMIACSSILVDIQKENQQGLSFRIFEALGYQKKIITNNQDIVNYDFYNPNNIFVISENDYTIPLAFFESEYIQIDAVVLDQYTLKSWIKKLFDRN